MAKVPLRCEPDDAVELLLGEFADAVLSAQPGIVDKRIEAAERAHGEIDDAGCARERTDVLLGRDCLPVGGDDLPGHRDRTRFAGRGDPAVVDDDSCALPGEFECLRPADAVAGAGDDGDLPAQPCAGSVRHTAAVQLVDDRRIASWEHRQPLLGPVWRKFHGHLAQQAAYVPPPRSRVPLAPGRVRSAVPLIVYSIDP
jgi:hypothetical protein